MRGGGSREIASNVTESRRRQKKLGYLGSDAQENRKPKPAVRLLSSFKVQKTFLFRPLR